MNAPTPVDTTDTTAQDGVTLVEKGIAVGEAAAEAALITAEPVLASPLLKPVWEAALNWIATQIFQPILTSFTGRVIVDAQEYVALRRAATAQAALDAAKKIGDTGAITEASSAVDQAVAGVIQYLGATHS